MAIGFAEMVDFFVNQLVKYYFGDLVFLSGFIIALFFIIFVSQGMPFTYSAIFSTPLALGLVLGNWLGANQWVMAVFLIAGGIIYAQALIRLFT